MSKYTRLRSWFVRERDFFIFAALLLLLWLSGIEWLIYSRSSIAEGEVWRLITGQYIHISLTHVLGNLAGLGIAWLLFADHWRGIRFWWVGLICAVGSNLGMFLLHPEINNYVGFSGALYGLIAYGAAQDIRFKIRFGLGILICLCLKVVYEYWYGPVSFIWLANEDSSPLAVESHLFGAITGLLIFVVVYFRARHNLTRFPHV